MHVTWCLRCKYTGHVERDLPLLQWGALAYNIFHFLYRQALLLTYLTVHLPRRLKSISIRLILEYFTSAFNFEEYKLTEITMIVSVCYVCCWPHISEISEHITWLKASVSQVHSWMEHCPASYLVIILVGYAMKYMQTQSMYRNCCSTQCHMN